MKKRMLSLLLAGTMVLGMMTGCGDTKTESNNNVVSSEKEGNAAESTESVAEKKEVVELKLIQFGTISERMEDFFENEFHDRILDELQIDLTVEFLPWGSQNDISVMLAGGDSFAFMNIPTAWKTVFIDNGYIIDIDPERVTEIAPNYINSRYGFGFDCVQIDGKYWALPLGSKVMAGDGSNISIRNDVLESVGLSWDKITNYDELMDAYAAVHEAYPDMWIAPTVQAAAKMYPEQVFGEGHYYNISGLDFTAVDQMTGEATAVYTADFFETLCKLNEEFYDLGYSSKEFLTDGTFQLAQWNAGNALTYLGYAEKAVNHDLTGVEGSEQRYLKISSLPTYKDKDYDWGVSFAKGEEENLDRWFEFFDWIYASEENYLFSIYGVEGEDWDYGEVGEIVPVTSDFMLSYWSYGSLFYDTFPDKDPEELKTYLALEDDYITNVTLGFSIDKTAAPFDWDSVQAALVTICDEKVKPIVYGFGDYDTEWPAVYEELKKAGYEEYCAEWIRQYNEWKAAK